LHQDDPLHSVVLKCRDWVRRAVSGLIGLVCCLATKKTASNATGCRVKLGCSPVASKLPTGGNKHGKAKASNNVFLTKPPCHYRMLRTTALISRWCLRHCNFSRLAFNSGCRLGFGRFGRRVRNRNNKPIFNLLLYK
jgi:hypothetical protein